ncbi:UDP-glucose dehydrogenase family protein [Thermolongibacillus altinsuensis]|uniref:UDP-glucose dehydrogenase family protein n=1 Tax=Thermolongibacillus altinsuensis TaxID=575256 RepID=UPI00242A2DA9|nr:UDP-glucose/GDP-mannose dehydrogenase family protein [Thermolongibacillus altinsuensis]GMB09339.1 UDP-glucose 6-dehydrogenase YwqF [Thermolongibacillus altinsuensis]
MNIAIAGTGYVGLVTGVCLAHIGHHVTCVDKDKEKIAKMSQGISPIYEPGLEELMKENMDAKRLHFTANPKEAYANANVIYIAVGTPEREDGSADLQYVEDAAREIARSIANDVIVVTKSTVPVGTNERIKHIIEMEKPPYVRVDIVSNPEFLREGSAIYDTFHGDRIVIGAENEEAANVIAKINEPFGIPIIKTDLRSAEMIKYAANAFLATKISFINEIANICEKVGANIDDVAYGIGQDHRIGPHFLRAGIGYGGSCFPKDTKALIQLSGNVDHPFELLQSVIKVNNRQRVILYEKAKQVCGSLYGKKAAVLGLAFKPNTDDMREAPSLAIIERLLADGVCVTAYDPVATEKAKALLGDRIDYASSPEEALAGADLAFIVTEWKQIVELPLSVFAQQMTTPLIFDGRNCYALDEAEKHGLQYVSIGRRAVGQILNNHYSFCQ